MNITKATRKSNPYLIAFYLWFIASVFFAALENFTIYLSKNEDEAKLVFDRLRYISFPQIGDTFYYVDKVIPSSKVISDKGFLVIDGMSSLDTDLYYVKYKDLICLMFNPNYSNSNWPSAHVKGEGMRRYFVSKVPVIKRGTYYVLARCCDNGTYLNSPMNIHSPESWSKWQRYDCTVGVNQEPCIIYGLFPGDTIRAILQYLLLLYLYRVVAHYRRRQVTKRNDSESSTQKE